MYIGQKVMYIGNGCGGSKKGFIFPKFKEIVTIKDLLPISEEVTLEEYKYDNNGFPQYFKLYNFCIFEESKKIISEFFDISHRIISTFYNENHEN